jgi:hypothetical protein
VRKGAQQRANGRGVLIEVENLRTDDPNCQGKLQPNAGGFLSRVSHDECDYASVHGEVLAPGGLVRNRRGFSDFEDSFCRVVWTLLAYNFDVS